MSGNTILRSAGCSNLEDDGYTSHSCSLTLYHFVKSQSVREKVWDLAVERLEDGPETFEHFTYVMTKHGPSNIDQNRKQRRAVL